MKTIITIALIIILWGCDKKMESETFSIANKTDTVNTVENATIALGNMKYNFNIVVNENTNSIDVDGYVEVDTLGFVVNEVKAFRKNNLNTLYIHFNHPKEYTTEEGNMDEKLKVKKQLALDKSQWKYATTANLILWNNDTSLSSIPNGFEYLHYTQAQLDSLHILNIEPKQLDNGTIPNVIWIK